MTGNTTLIEKREALKDRMASGEYRSLAEVILDGTGSLIQETTQKLTEKLTKSQGPEPGKLEEQISVWYNGGVIALVTLLIGFLASLLFGESLSLREIQLSIWAAGTGCLALVANRIMVRMFLNTFRESPLDAIGSVANLENLQSWLKANFDRKKPLFLCLTLGPLLGIFLYMVWIRSNQQVFHLGPMVIAIFASFQALLAIYYLYPFYVALPARLSGYQFDLFTADPSSSEVVGRLSDLLTNVMYITIAYIIGLTLSLVYFKFLILSTGLFIGIMVWAPAILLYATGQYHLSSIICEAKWKMLNEIQKKIETLQAQKEIPTQETLDHLEKLMNYHDRIKNTPDSTLNFRAGLNFLNSLLLPVIAFVLANIDRVIEFFSTIQKRLTTP